MPSKKQSSNARHSALVIEARAGLIPESDWIEDEVRARMRRTARIGRAIKANARLATCGSDTLAISDILADLRHYCDSRGLAFDELDAAACENYYEEASQTRMIGCPLT